MTRRIKKLISELPNYPRLRDKVLSLYNVLLISKKIRSLPLPGRGKIIEVSVKNCPAPFALRLGSTDWHVLVEIFLDGEYSEVLRCFENNSPSTIVDLGSNVGLSIRYWGQYFPTARVVAVEPDEENCKILRRNIKLGKCSHQVSVIEACIVGASTEYAYLESEDNREWAYRVNRAGGARCKKVAAVTMSDIMRQIESNGRIDLLKCDIEGGEAEVFKECSEWISEVKHAVVEVHGTFSIDDLENAIRSGTNKSVRRATTGPSVAIFYIK